MKKLLFVLIALIFASCKNTTTQENTSPLDKGAYAKSAGRVNNLAVIMENQLWQGELGDIVRKHLAAPVTGLPQEEPLFTLRQMSPQAFAGFARKARCFIDFSKKSGHLKYDILTNKYARPQTGIVIQANSNKKIIAQFLDQKDSIIAIFKNQELVNKQAFIKNPLKVKNLHSKLGYHLQIPNAYRIAKETDTFFWFRKNISHGTLNLITYNIPDTYFKDSLTVTQNIVAMRNDIGGNNIEVDQGGRFITEEAYSPYLLNTTINKLSAYQTKGTWEVKNKYMAGPFINYTIHDPKNHRYLVLEGFVFAPTITKRDYMFELESIIKSIHF